MTEDPGMSCGIPLDPRALLPERGGSARRVAGGRNVATGSASRSSRLAKAAHICLGGAGWSLLGLLWLWQSNTRYIPGDWAIVVAATGAGGLALAALSVAWVRWNQGIYRRRHRRLTPLIAEVQFETDAVGRPIVATPEAVDGSRIVIRIDAAGVKRYLIG